MMLTNETKFAQLLGKLEVISDRLGRVATDVGNLQISIDRVETKTTNTRIIIVTTVIGAALTIVGLTYGIIGYGHQVADSISAAYTAGQGVKNPNGNGGHLMPTGPSASPICRSQRHEA